jgi:hypothetical protein
MKKTSPEAEDLISRKIEGQLLSIAKMKIIENKLRQQLTEFLENPETLQKAVKKSEEKVEEKKKTAEEKISKKAAEEKATKVKDEVAQYQNAGELVNAIKKDKSLLKRIEASETELQDNDMITEALEILSIGTLLKDNVKAKVPDTVVANSIIDKVLAGATSVADLYGKKFTKEAIQAINNKIDETTAEKLAKTIETEFAKMRNGYHNSMTGVNKSEKKENAKEEKSSKPEDAKKEKPEDLKKSEKDEKKGSDEEKGGKVISLDD